MIRGSITTLVAMLLMGEVHAANVPPALLGKSVVVTWNEVRTQREAGQAQFHQVQATHNLALYVSSTGRVFSRQTNRTRSGTGATEQVAGDNTATRVPRFQGRSLTLFMPYTGGGGMRRVSVEFDDSYSSCTARVTHARQQGARTQITFSPITKRNVEFQSATASGESCSIRSGNVFGAS
jgi:hypothetical protein